MFDYIRDPAEIYEKSFALVRAEADLSGLDDADAAVAVRLIHACGLPAIAADLVFGAGAVAAGRGALAGGAPVLAYAACLGAALSYPRMGDPVPIRDLVKRGLAELAALHDHLGVK